MNFDFYASKKKIFVVLAVLAFLHFLTPANAQMRQIYLDPNPDNEIRKISFYSPSEGFVAFRDWVGFTSDSGSTFTKKYITQTNVDFGLNTVNLTFGFWIEGVEAFNRDTLIAYGHYGLVPSILYSNDGGNTFTLVYHKRIITSEFKTGITDMIFPEDEVTGFAIDADCVLKTTNGGLSWSRVWLDPGRYFTNLQALNNKTVFAFSTKPNMPRFVRTFNGGSTWGLLPLPEGDISSAYLNSGSVGWISMLNGNKYRMYKTTTSGSSWSVLNDPEATPFLSYEMKFTNDTTGYAFGFMPDDPSGGQYTVFKTTSGGSVWEPLARDNNFSHLGFHHNDLYFLNDTQFWAGGGHGFLEMTTNAGGPTLPKAFFKVDTAGSVPGGNVKLLNFSRLGYQYIWYINGTLLGNDYLTSYQHQFSRSSDTIKLVVTNGSYSDTTTKIQHFVVPPIPVVNSFNPAHGSTGTMITIQGANLSGVTHVSFGGVSASSFSLVSPTMIRAIVGNGATGNVSLTTLYGTVSYPGFTYFAAPISPPPVISSFSPQHATVGTQVTINGNHFNTVPAENVVFFGAVKGVVLSATTTKIECIVPAGASLASISILNKANRLTAYSNEPFSPVFADSSHFKANSFTMAINYGRKSGDWPRFVEATDLDDDGKPDLVCWLQKTGSDSVEIYRNTSTGGNFSFAPKIQMMLETGNGSAKFAIKDLDGDSKPEIVFVNNNGHSVHVYQNNSSTGSISFSPSLTLPTVHGSWDIVVDDLDYDGRPDLVVAGINNNDISVIRNTSSPGHLSFAQNSNFLAGKSVALGDIDGDGRKDVVSFRDGMFSVFRNISTPQSIQLSQKIDFVVNGVSNFSLQVSVVDFDGDRQQDVIVSGYDGYHFYRNTTSGGIINFTLAKSYNILTFSEGMTIANFSGDSRPDVLKANDYHSNMYLYRNVSVPGTIKTDSVNGVPWGAYYVNAADMNLDGRPDILLSSRSAIAILKNNVGDKIPVSLCADGVGAIDSDLPGTSYQWQQKQGSFFVNIDDNAVFSGTKTAKLNLSNIPLAFHETIFRCVIDSDKYSSVYLLKVTSVKKPDVHIAASSGSICFGTNVTFTATTVDGGASPSYIWQVNGVSLTDIYNLSTTFQRNNLKHDDKVRVIVVKQNDCGTVRDTSNIITMIVTGGPSSVSILSSVTSICAGTPVTFTAIPVNGGSPTYQWLVNGSITGTNNNTFTSNTFMDGDEVKVIMTPSGTCLTATPVNSNIIRINVASSLPPAVTISSSSASICQGSNISFTAMPTNGGDTPSYQWQVNDVNAGNNSPTFNTTALNNDDVIKVIMTSNAACIGTTIATSNLVKVKVNDAVVPSVNIVASATSICAGTSVVFSASPVNGGDSPSFQWMINGVIFGTNKNIFSTSLLNDNDIVKVVMTSNATCVTNSTTSSNPIAINVISPPVASVSISASAENVCQGSEVSFTAAPFNGGSSPYYQWRVNGAVAGTNSNTFKSSILNDSDEVSVMMTSSNQCATPVASNSIRISVNSIVTPAVDIDASSTTICAGNSVIFKATPVNSGNTPTYQWKVNGTDAGNNSNTFTASSLNDGDEVRVIMTSNASCVSAATTASDGIRITVIDNMVPSVSITSSANAICEGAPVTFTCAPSNAGSSPTYQWQVNGINVGSNSKTYTGNSFVNNDAVTVVLTSHSSCAVPASVKSDAIVLSVTAASTPSISISGATMVAAQQSAVITSASSNGGVAPLFEWQDSTGNHTWQTIVGETGTTISYIPAATGDKLRCVLTSNATCVSQPTIASNVLEFTVTTVTAIDPLPASHYSIRLYPNPVTSSFIVDSLKLSDTWESLEINSLDGKQKLLSKNIFNRSSINLDVSHFPAGMYFVILRRKSGETAFFRFVKQ